MRKFPVFAAILITFFFISNRSAFCQNTDVTPVTAKTCIVSGETIEEGHGVELKYLDKTYNFCCTHCVAKFKAEPMSYIKEDIKCPVGGESASKDVSTVVDGVKYYFCCEKCVEKFKNDPEKYLNKEKKEDK